jgi:hypothetical protein
MRILLIVLILFLNVDSIFASATISTLPRVERIRPDFDLVDTQIKIEPNSEYEVVVRTPKSHPLISTDFPIVEDTLLYHFRGFTKNGVIRFKTIYPIRGRYDINVSVNGQWEQLTLDIGENPDELRNLTVFLIFLFGLGVFGGVVLQRTARAERESLKLSSITTLLVLSLAILFYPNTGDAHSGPHEVEKKGMVQWMARDEAYTLTVRFDSNQAVVGRPVVFDIRLVNENKAIREPFTVNIQTFHEEDQTIMFEGSFSSSEISGASCGLCSLSPRLQFFDGAKTRITFTVLFPNGKKMEVDGVIDVEGVAPSVSVKIKTILLVGFLNLAGVAVGFFLIPSGRRKIKNAV